MFDDRGDVHIGQYMGRQRGFECLVCGAGCNAHTFNIWYDNRDYETWGYGDNHLPTIVKDLGVHNNIIKDELKGAEERG